MSLIRYVFSLISIALIASCQISVPTGQSSNEFIESISEEVTLSEGINIIVLNVGQGDATLVLGPENDEGERVVFLVDAGGLEPNGFEIISETLSDLNIQHIDHVVVSHYDADHFGGLVTINETGSLIWDDDCQPRGYYPKQSLIDLGDSDKTTFSVAEYLFCREETKGPMNLQHLSVGGESCDHMGHEVSLGDEYKAQMIAGDGCVKGQSEKVSDVDTDNERSIVVLVSGPDDFHFLIAGDMTGQPFGAEDALVEESLALSLFEEGIELSGLRVGHHGSANASSPFFLETLHPLVSFISTGDNSFGHPHCQTYETLAAHSESIWQTALGSDESLSCDLFSEVQVSYDHIQITHVDGEMNVMPLN
jgi:beta-lactamase superfamily II metal-dependent hydrolase